MALQLKRLQILCGLDRFFNHSHFAYGFVESDFTVDSNHFLYLQYILVWLCELQMFHIEKNLKLWFMLPKPLYDRQKIKNYIEVRVDNEVFTVYDYHLGCRPSETSFDLNWTIFYLSWDT